MRAKHWTVLIVGTIMIIAGFSWCRNKDAGPSLVLFGYSAVVAALVAALVEKKGSNTK